MSCRVLHVLPDLTPYGLERVVASLATLGDRSRFEISVAALYPEFPGSLSPSLRSAGVRVFHLDKHKGLDLRMFGRLSKVFRELRPDVVHTHNYVLRYVMPPALLHRVPLVVHTIHNVADQEVDRAGVMLQKWAFRRMVQPVVIAEEGALSYERVYGMPRPPLIFNGIDVERYDCPQGTREQWRREHGFNESDFLFVCVARFFMQKNHQTLIEAFSKIASKFSKARLLLAGDGHLQDAVEQQVRELGLADRVHFLGRREDIPQLLAASDTFALASLWEGNPLSVMEAMAAGLPTVVTSVGGVPELVENGKHGSVVPPSDALAMSEAMSKMITGSAMRREMSEAAVDKARKKFGQKQMVEAYESLYGELLFRGMQGKADYAVS
jgi:glycosyltransferase involved in cell wall biosynthesis